MWYSVEALYNSEIVEDYEPLYKFKIFIIDVGEDCSPDEKALLIARSFEYEYKNCEGEKVFWRLNKIIEIQELFEETIYDGVEVFSRLRNDNFPDFEIDD